VDRCAGRAFFLSFSLLLLLSRSPTWLHPHSPTTHPPRLFSSISLHQSSSPPRFARPACERAPDSAPPGQAIATFAGGCFWGLELAFQREPGVTHTSVGYTGGPDPAPTYETVCSGRTGHTEAVQVYYDPAAVSYDRLLDLFFSRVDPTTKDRQGNDVGTQYRSGIYWHTPEQKAAAEAAIARVNAELAAGTFRRVAGKSVVSELEPAGPYYVAEAYHQQYLSRGGRFGAGQSAAKGCTDPIRCYG
jgi:peptide-methionine (S)-S-oxide reductase